MQIRTIAVSLFAMMTLSVVGVSHAGDAALSNRDVIDLVKAKMAESTIIRAIHNGKTEFDTSPQALIALSKAGVPTAIIDAMLAPAERTVVAGDQINPEEVIMISGDSRTQMRYVNPTVRTAARGLGFGGVGQYAVLHGSQAKLRITDGLPRFTVAVPDNAQPESYVTLVNLAIRRNDTREVMIGGGYMSYSTGINKDRIIATIGDALTDQSQAPEGFQLYELAPKTQLPAGEYAIVFYSSQVNVAGYFTRGGDSYFDFGVDH